MGHDKQLSGLIGPEESTRVMGALQRGASRRDVLAMLMAGGMQATLAGGIAASRRVRMRKRRARAGASRWPGRRPR